MRSILIILFFILTIVSSKSYGQRWLPGHFTDANGNVETGLIRIDPSGRPPVKGEGFIEFKEDKKADIFKISASGLRSIVTGPDSFVVAHAPGNETWARNEFDFVRVVLNEDPKLYAAGDVMVGGGGSGLGLGIAPEIGAGIGTGGFGTGVGAGVYIPIGGGGGTYKDQVYYYGDNPADMKPLNNQNFEDIMTDMMGDYPEVVDKIRAKVYVLGNIGRLIAYYKQVEGAEK